MHGNQFKVFPFKYNLQLKNDRYIAKLESVKQGRKNQEIESTQFIKI